VPAGLVARIVCFGPVGVTAGLRNWALSSEVELVFCSQRGRYLGQVISGHTNRIERLRNQLTAAGTPERSLPLARKLVEAKICKQAVLLRRTMRKDTARALAECVEMMEGYADMLPDAGSRDEIMGLEGAAARAYFQGWAACVDPEFGFTGRNRRPPLDVVNSALSSVTRSCCPRRSPRLSPPVWTRESGSCTPTTTAAPAWRWISSRSSVRWSSTR
jgi:CRISPR-associated protein Cas1